MAKKVVQKSRKPVTEDTTTLGYTVSLRVREEFAEACRERSEVIQEAIAGAMVVWKHLPADIREAARLEAKGKTSVDHPDTVLSQKIKAELQVKEPQETYRSQDAVALEAATAEDEIHELKYRLGLLEGLFRQLQIEKAKGGGNQANNGGVG